MNTCTFIIVLALEVILIPVVAAQRQSIQTPSVYTEEGRKNVNGAECYYKVMGKGEPIVILHGGPEMDHTYLLPQMGKLAEKFQLIFYDQRASGGSVAAMDSSTMTLATFVEDLEEIRKAFGLEKMNLMGHSWGGMLAMFYAVKYPDRLNSLMLINSGGARSDFWQPFYANINRERTPEDSLKLAQIKASGDLENNKVSAWEDFFKTFFGPFFYDQSFRVSLTIQFTRTTIENMPLFTSGPLDREIKNYNIVDQLSVITCPTLIMHGENDVIPVEFAKEIHDHIEGSDLFILGHCGHFPYIEKPDKFFSIISGFMDEI